MFRGNSNRLYRYLALWFILSLFLFGISFLINSYIQMSHGDLNRNGIVDGTDIALVATYSNDSANHSIDKTVLIAPPTANTAGPTRVNHQPVVIEL